MTNYELAKKLADEYLKMRSDRKYVLLFEVASYIDRKMKEIKRWKRKNELHDSLYDYEVYVPDVRWVSSEELTGTLCRALGGEFLVVKNPYYGG